MDAAELNLPVSIPVIIGCIFGFFALLAIIIVVSVMKKVSPALKSAKQMMDTQTKANVLRSSGIAAQATVVAVQPTGKMMNYSPVVGMTLDVTPPQGGDTYQVQIEQLVAQVNIPRVQPGATVPVKLNPSNPNDLVLDI